MKTYAITKYLHISSLIMSPNAVTGLCACGLTASRTIIPMVTTNNAVFMGVLRIALR